MKPFIWRVIAGVGLLAFGALLLLQNLNLLSLSGNTLSLLVAGLFAVGGLAFLSVLASNGRANWWAAIPGCTLLAIGTIITLPFIAPQWNRLGGTIMLGGIGLSFWIIYLLVPQNWWAIIPGGVMFTLAAVAGLDNFSGFETGGIFFLGLGATFALLALLPARNGAPLRWAWIPAGIMLLMGIFISAAETRVFGFVWPVVLILGGAFMLFRSMRRSS
jgi:hypothetical protein